jgi:hypothetical protein
MKTHPATEIFNHETHETHEKKKERKVASDELVSIYHSLTSDGTPRDGQLLAAIDRPCWHRHFGLARGRHEHSTESSVVFVIRGFLRFHDDGQFGGNFETSYFWTPNASLHCPVLHPLKTE